MGLWQLVGFASTSLFGTLLHFLYDWSDKSQWIAPFSGVNESTFEHMKLLFWPMLLFAVIESLFANKREAFWSIRLEGILVGLTLIPVLFYTYNGVIGKSPDWINIAIFFLSAAVAYLYIYLLEHRAPTSYLSPVFALLILAALALAFVLFTFYPPRIALFCDPLTGAYGISA